MPTALVTGASTGIGRATAVLLAQRSWRVLAGVRKTADADALTALGLDGLEPVILDVTNPEHVAEVTAHVEATCPEGLDALVNNAGIAYARPVEVIELDAFRNLLEVNVVGVVAITQALLPALKRARGRIVNIGSTGSRVTPPFMGTYTASKHALAALNDALRQELAPRGMKVVLLEPGAIATPIWDKGEAEIAQLRDTEPQLFERYPEAVDTMSRVVKQQAEKGIPPEAVARVAWTALTANEPKARYPVGTDAHIATFLGRHLPPRWMDALIARFR